MSQYKIQILRCVSPLHKAYYNHNYDRSVFFHRKGGSELDNLREFYKFSGHCAVWPKAVSLRCEKEFLAWLQGARPGGEGSAVRRLVPFTLALISKPRPSQLQIHCQFSADPHVPGIYSCKINQYWTSMILNSPSSTGSPLHLKVERSSGVHFGTCGELGGTVCNTQCLVWFHTNFRCWHTFVVYCKCIPLLMHPIQPSCYLSGNQCIKTSSKKTSQKHLHIWYAVTWIGLNHYIWFNTGTWLK